MSERKQAHADRHEADTSQAGPQAAGLRDDSLDEAVECCLAEIDAALAETQSETERAAAEFEKIKGRLRERMQEANERIREAVTVREENAAYAEMGTAENDAEDELRLLQATYAHLGLDVGICCGEAYFYLPDGPR